MPIKTVIFITACLFSLYWLLFDNCRASEGKEHLGYIPQPIYPKRPQRILNFPQAYTVGEIRIASVSSDKTVRSVIELEGAAKGKVVVPAGKEVTLIASQRLFREPTLIATLPADGIDCLALNATSWADSEDGLLDRALSFAGHLSGLSALVLDRSDATDASIARAAELPNLQSLSAFSTMCEGGCLKQLGRLKKLRILRLGNSTLKEENLQYLSNLPQLEYLTINRSGLTDNGMKYLAKCHNLTALGIAKNPKVSDAGLIYLVSLKKLRYVDLAGTSITIPGLIRLKQNPALAEICLPQLAYSRQEMDVLHQAFPKVLLYPRVKAHTDEDAGTLFAPLH